MHVPKLQVKVEENPFHAPSVEYDEAWRDVLLAEALAQGTVDWRRTDEEMRERGRKEVPAARLGKYVADTAKEKRGSPSAKHTALVHIFSQEPETTSSDTKLDPNELFHATSLEQAGSKALSDAQQALDSKIGSASFLSRFYPDYTPVPSLREKLGIVRPAPLWSHIKTTQLLVSCGPLQIASGNWIEPFFLSVCLYDLDTGEMLTEQFDVDANPNTVLPESLAQQRSNAHEACLTPHTLVQVERPDASIVLLVRVNRILQGDPEGLNDFYTKQADKKSSKETAKAQAASNAAVQRLAAYRQPFLWGVVPLFDSQGALLQDKVTLDALFFQKEPMDTAAFSKLVQERLCQLQESPSSLKRRLLYGASVSLHVQEVGRVSPLRTLDPSGRLCQREDDEFLPLSTEQHEHGLAREVLLLRRERLLPHVAPVNLMMVYPMQAKVNKVRNLACSVSLRLHDETVEQEGESCLFGQSSTNLFVRERICSVSYHNYEPYFNDEIKVQLPVGVYPKAHFLLTFYRVNCKVKVGKDTASVVGYSALPLFPAGSITSDGDHTLRIVPSLKPGYLCDTEPKEGADFWEGETKEDYIRVSTRALTSLYSADHAFNTLFHVLSTASSLDTESQGKVCSNALRVWRTAQPESFVLHMVPALNVVLHIMATGPRTCAMYAFKAANVLAEAIQLYHPEDTRHHTMLQAYVDRLLDPARSPTLAEAVVRQLRVALAELVDGSDVDVYEREAAVPASSLAASMAWFWLDIALKDVLVANALTPSCVEELHGLVEHAVRLLFGHRQGVGLTMLKSLNQSLALFLADLFRVADRSVCFRLVSAYTDKLESSSDTVIMDFKASFLATLLDSPTVLDAMQLPDALRVLGASHGKQGISASFATHFPILDALLKFVDECVRLSAMEPLRSKAIDVLQDLLLRMTFGSDMDTALATACIPLVLLAVHDATFLTSLQQDHRKEYLSCIAWTLRHCDMPCLLQCLLSELQTEEAVQHLCACLKEMVSAFAFVRRHDVVDTLVTILAPETTQGLLEVKGPQEDYKSNIENLMSSYLNTTRNASLRKRASKAEPSMGRSSKFGMSMRGKKNTSSRKKYLEQRNQLLQSGGSVRTSKTSESTFTGDEESKKLEQWESAVNQQASHIVINTIYSIAHAWETQGAARTIPSSSWERLYDVAVVLLRGTQCVEVYAATYALIQYLLVLTHSVAVKAKDLFQHARHVSPLCQTLLWHCTLDNLRLRVSATVSLYLVAKTTFLVCRNYDAFQEAVTFALSTSVHKLQGKGALYLEQALQCLGVYARSDRSLKGNFDKVLGKLQGVYDDTMEIARQEALGDSADLAVYQDLLVNMAESYHHLPDVRRGWLSQLAKHHQDQENHAEAAQCFLEQARLLKSESRVRRLSDADDDRVPDTVVDDLYLAAAQESAKAYLYEECYSIYTSHLLGKHFEEKRYALMCSAFGHLHSVFGDLVKVEESKYRLLGTYYRIGFFGDKFGKHHGQYFIYKRPKITQLSEIMDYMKETYGTRLKCPIHIIQESGDVSKKVDRSKASIQITFVKPLTDASRQTYIEQNSKVCKFTFTTPFTKGGKARSDDIRDQCMKTTVLTVAHEFPFFSTRQAVAHVEEIILSPVQSATDNVLRRIEQFENTLASANPDKQTLSSLLQGSILLQVHGGAQQICHAFFGEEAAADAHADALRQAIKDFLQACERALAVFNTLTTEEDAPLVQELEKHFAAMQMEMWPMLKQGRADRKQRGVRFS